MENKIPTASQFFKDHYYGDIIEFAVSFAKLHVEAALKMAAENSTYNVIDETSEEIIEISGIFYEEGIRVEINENSILNAYPLENVR